MNQGRASIAQDHGAIGGTNSKLRGYPRDCSRSFRSRKKENTCRPPSTPRRTARPAAFRRRESDAIGSHLPDCLSAIFALVHAETNGFAVGRPSRKMRKPRAMRQLAELSPIGMDGIEAAAANIDDLAAIR